MTTAKKEKKEPKIINVKPQYDNKQKELKSVYVNGALNYQVTYDNKVIYLNESLDDAMTAYNKAGLLKPKLKNWYDHATDDWINATRNADMSKHYDMFLNNIEKSAEILDIGCGSGRDTKYFIEHGFKTTSLDNSKKMCNLTKKYAGKKSNVLNVDILEIDETHTFDAIWAMASFVHMQENTLKSAFEKINKILKPGGVFYTCLKEVANEYVDDLGRIYPKTSVHMLKEHLTNAGFVDIETYSTDDKLGRGNNWINLLARQPGHDLSMSPEF